MKQPITVLLLCAILMSSCSEQSIESHPETNESDESITDSVGSVVFEENETEDTLENVEDPVKINDPVTIISNNGNLNLHSVLLPDQGESSGYIPFAYDDRYSIYLTYGYERSDNDLSYKDITLYVIDAMNGTIVCEKSLETTYKPTDISYTDTGCVIYDVEFEDGIYTVNCAYTIDKTEDGFTVSETEAEVYPRRDRYFYSPDGTAAAYDVTDDGSGDGGINIQYADGEVKRILDNTMLDETGEKGDAGLGGVTGYTPYGFIDDTHLVYSITGWEWLKGYGIYDISTDTTEEIYGTYRPIGIYDGILYISATENGLETYSIEASEIWSVSPDGVKKVIASTEEAEGVFPLTFDQYYTFDQSKFVFYHTGIINGIEYGGAEETIMVSIYSPDLTELLAEIEYPKDMNALENVIIFDDNVTIVARTKTDID